MDAGGLQPGIESTKDNYPDSGGGADDYAATTHSMIFAGNIQLAQGAVLCIFWRGYGS